MYSSSNRKQPASSPQPLDKYERFEQWLRENGAKFELVRSFVVQGGHPVGPVGFLRGGKNEFSCVHSGRLGCTWVV